MTVDVCPEAGCRWSLDTSFDNSGGVDTETAVWQSSNIEIWKPKLTNFTSQFDINNLQITAFLSAFYSDQQDHGRHADSNF